MSIEVTFPEPNRETNLAKGSAGLQTRMGGAATTVSALIEGGKSNQANIVKKSIG